jgi:hypothetical protein
MSTPEAELRRRNLLTLAGLGALFLAPLLAAVWLYYGTGWRPAGHVNHGQLITPPRRLPSLDLPLVRLEEGGAGIPPAAPPLFRGTWTLAYVGDGSCDAACRRTLYVMRQTQAALGTDMTRVSRVFLVTGRCCAKAYLAQEGAGIRVIDASGPAGKELLGEFPPGGWPYSVFVVDPLGNLMMRYDVRRSPRGLLIDLRRLLSLSDIG